MRLTAFCLLAGLMQVHATGISQTVSYSGSNVSLEKVFDAIERQTGYVFFYNASLIKDARPVTLHLEHASLEEALRGSLQGQPLGYDIENKTIVISRKPVPEKALEQAPTESAPEIDSLVYLKGRIVDSSYAPLEGASVLVKGEPKGTETDVNGFFTFRAPANGQPVLIISYTGYVTREVRWTEHIRS